MGAGRFLVPLTIVIYLVAFPIFGETLDAQIDYPYAVAFQTIRTPLFPVVDRTIDQNELSFRLNLRWINVWSIQANRFVIDGEEMQMEPSLRYGFTRRLSGGVSVPWKIQGGGTMDSMIEAFHRSIRVTQNGRENFQRNRINVSYEPLGSFYGILDNNVLATLFRNSNPREYPRSVYDPPIQLNLPASLSWIQESIPLASEDRMGVENPNFYLRYKVIRQSRWLPELHAGVQYRPAMVHYRALFASPGNDVAIYTVAYKDIPSLKLKTGMGVSLTGYQKKNFMFLSLPSNQAAYRVFMGYGEKDWNLTLEYAYFTTPVRHFGNLSRAGHFISLAYATQVNGSTLVVGFAENFKNFGVSPDIGFFFTLDLLKLHV